ncbi:iron-siderophore ABC transporter substrate-binding protein [Streptomyces sp. NP160]|uniref:iron-siderophore ABC transporter substrate-binding protein n=1 Tax=Streptomyces sp. NP160 TaxID=2586637 RepID=UPI001119A80D|nr:iron-siderophore ABC transporter substrate-binding protein [Streptomyces sp. NP160]TNM68907.1 iron-siderophore ABC transporter substrate-binding protein [Streptomyces sp. NP160]
MRRRDLLALVPATAIAAALAACSSGGTASDGASGAAPSSAASGSGGAAGGAFPATVQTKFGAVTIESAPQRVVALGWGDAETALALGVQPVGASDWLAFGGEGVGPWAAGLYTTAPTIIETLEPSYEAIAALRPDLILDTKSSGDQARYERLSQIAPTVGVPTGGDSYLTTTRQQMELVSTALGKQAEGQQLLEGLRAGFEQAAADHPQWKGRTATVATKTSNGWGAYVAAPGGDGSDPLGGRVEFMEALGFQQNPKIAALPANSGGFSVDVSTEQLDLLDADVVVAFPIFIPTTDITGDAAWNALPAVTAEHALVIDGDTSSAFSLGTTLATQYALEQLVPQLETVSP